MLHIFIVDIHNQSSHPEYCSTRAEVWNRAISEFPPALPPSHQELSVLIGGVIERKITRKGVEFEGLVYSSSELARLRSRAKTSAKTKVKYDPTDLSKIYVFDEDNCQFIEREFDRIKKGQEVERASPWVLNPEKVFGVNKYKQSILQKD